MCFAHLMAPLLGLASGFTVHSVVPEIGTNRRTLQRSSHIASKTSTQHLRFTRAPEWRSTALVASAVPMITPELDSAVKFVAALLGVGWTLIQIIRFSLKDKFDKIDRNFEEINKKFDDINKNLKTTNNCVIAGFKFLNISWTKVGFWRDKDGFIVELDQFHTSNGTTTT